MAKPLDKLKKIRSLDEILTRGGQAISVYREQRRGGTPLPTDEEFYRLINKNGFGSAPVIPETLWQKFYKNGEQSFFPPFRDAQQSAAAFREAFGDQNADKHIDAADRIADGRIDLLGLKNLFVGTEIEWHREPVSAKRSPMKHWKEFDELDSSEIGNRKTLWELNRHQHFFTLGLAYWLTGDERYAATFVSHLGSWIEQNPPGIGINWSSSLEVSFRAMSWIWAFHFFRESEHFTPELFKNAVKHLYCHGRHIEQYLSTYYSPNTHLTGEGLGLYYLGTQLPFLERAGHWRKLGEDIMFSEVSKQILPDGVYFEQSTWYQRYTVDFYLQFVVLRSMSGEPYFNAPAAAVENGLQNAFDFLMNVTLPDGRTPLIGDDDGGRLLPLTNAEPDDFRGTLAVGASIFGRGDHKYVAGRASEEIFWLLGPDGLASYDRIEETEPKTTSADFPQGGYAVMRDGWSDTDNFLMVDCGEVGSLAGGHGHADVLSIEASVHGRPLLVDSGTFTYQESRELRDYFRSSTAHNTLIIDRVSSSVPGNTFAWKTRADAARKCWIADERFDFFEGSHNGYERLADPATHTRSILFLKGDYWVMRDVVETAGEHEYSLNFHFDQDVRTAIAADGQSVGGRDHRLFTFGDNGSWQQKESWISNDHGNRVNAPFLRFMSSGTGTQEFFTFLFPVGMGQERPDVTELQMASGRAFVIKYSGYTDVFVFNDEPGKTIDNGIFGSNFKYSWARLSEGETRPDEFVVIDGSGLVIDGNAVFSDAIVPHAAVRRFGHDLYIKAGTERRTMTIGRVERRKAERRQPSSDRRSPA